MKSFGLAGTNPCFGVCPLKLKGSSVTEFSYSSNKTEIVGTGFHVMLNMMQILNTKRSPV